MLPNMEITAGVAIGGGQTAAMRNPAGERALVAYRATQENEKGMAIRKERPTETEAEVAAKREKHSERFEKRAETEDLVEIHLRLSHEERDAIEAAFSARETAGKLTEEEKEAAQKASERITKYVEDAIAANRENRDRVEKAVGEWYSRLSKGEPRGASDFIQLFRQAAMGLFDDED